MSTEERVSTEVNRHRPEREGGHTGELEPGRVSYRDKIAEAIRTGAFPDVVHEWAAEIAAEALAVRDPELDRLSQENDRLAARVAEYENAITWDTSCLACSATLDSSIKEHERAEKAEAAIERARSHVARLRSWYHDPEATVAHAGAILRDLERALSAQ